MIHVLNQSTVAADGDIERACAAITQGVNRAGGFRSHWGKGAHVAFSRNGVRPSADPVIVILDDSDSPGALAWHSEDNGVPDGRVFAKTILEAGGTPLRGSMSIAAALDHEVKELLADAAVQLWAQNYSDGWLYAYEVCDPVENDTYELDGVSLSNYVFPHWFDDQASGMFDHNGTVQAPFTMSPGGYVVRTKAGQVQTNFGDQYPAWRLDIKPFGRTERRIGDRKNKTNL